jgi:hypothetical protein
MLGSYIGLTIGLIGAYFSFTAVKALCEFGPCKPTAMVIPLIPAVLGFLFGWLFHWTLRRMLRP